MHMQASIADRFLLVFNLSSQIVSCRSTHEQNNGWTSDLGVFKNISISTFPNYYEAVMQTCEIPAIRENWHEKILMRFKLSSLLIQIILRRLRMGLKGIISQISHTLDTSETFLWNNPMIKRLNPQELVLLSDSLNSVVAIGDPTTNFKTESLFRSVFINL